MYRDTISKSAKKKKNQKFEEDIKAVKIEKYKEIREKNSQDTFKKGHRKYVSLLL